MSWFVLLDVMVAVLLAVTILYAVILNRKLVRLRENPADFGGVTSGFHEAVARAEASVATLKVSTTDLQDRLDQAQSLRDDLVALIRRGESVADHLEEGVRAGRKHDGPRPRPQTPPAMSVPRPVGAKSATTPRSEAERDLLKALASARRGR